MGKAAKENSQIKKAIGREGKVRRGGEPSLEEAHCVWRLHIGRQCTVEQRVGGTGEDRRTSTLELGQRPDAVTAVAADNRQTLKKRYNNGNKKGRLGFETRQGTARARVLVDLLCGERGSEATTESKERARRAE